MFRSVTHAKVYSYKHVVVDSMDTSVREWSWDVSQEILIAIGYGHSHISYLIAVSILNDHYGVQAARLVPKHSSFIFTYSVSRIHLTRLHKGT